MNAAPTNAGDQVGNFLSRVSKLFGIRKSAGPNTALVPFKTALQLTAQQEEDLVNHALLRREELIKELGIGELGAQNPAQDAEDLSWAAKRDRYEQVYRNRKGWRKSYGIFKSSNLIVPVARRVVRQMVARAVDYFFATDPWFAGYPQDPDSAANAGFVDRVQRFTRYKAERAKLKRTLTNAVELAFVRGEAVVKTRHLRKEQLFRSFAMVLVDARGKFILDNRGDYIFEDDGWVPELAKDEATGEPMVDPTTGAPQETGRLLLKKDGVTVKPTVGVFVERLITRRMTQYHGPDVDVVYFKDFLCPLTASSIQDADINIHNYDQPVMDIADLYRRRNVLQSADESLDDLRGVVSVLEHMVAASSEPKSERNQPRTEEGETQNTSGVNNPNVQLAECWLRYDADGDGLLEEIMILIDVANRRAIFYDYAPNLTDDGLRPFNEIKINFLDGRWHGYGAMEMFFPSQEVIDLLVNRVNFAQSGAGRVTFWNPAATLEGQADPKLKLNDGKTYTLAPTKKPEDALGYVTLPEVKGPDLFKLMEFFTQIVQLESGVVHAGDQGFAGLESAKLATGIRNIERSGQEMFGLYIGQLDGDLGPVMDKFLACVLGNMDEREVYDYFDGEEGKKMFGSITKDEVKNVIVKAQLLLTRYKGEQQLQSNMQADALIKTFYALPLPLQQIVAGLYIQMLKALQIQRAEQYIQPGVAWTGEVPGAGGGPAPSPAAGAAAINSVPQGQVAPNV